MGNEKLQGKQNERKEREKKRLRTCHIKRMGQQINAFVSVCMWIREQIKLHIKHFYLDSNAFAKILNEQFVSKHLIHTSKHPTLYSTKRKKTLEIISIVYISSFLLIFKQR